MLSRPVRTFIACLLTGVTAGACLWVVVSLVAAFGPAVGGVLAIAFVVLALLVFTGRDAWVWALLNVDDPMSWLAFLPPLWRWARRADRVATWS